MPLNIRNEAVNQLAAKLAARTHTNKIDAVRIALENELRRRDEAIAYWGVPKVRALFGASYLRRPAQGRYAGGVNTSPPLALTAV
jgi:hypothetical protein